MTELRATLRLQLHAGFTLDDARAQVPYFARLGVSHLYLSPVLQARAGSTHGYDVVDPTRVNPELGGEPALERLVAALREHHMGLILDLVPNHMAVGGGDNPWWLDVLEWGRASPYAQFFDIQWQSHDPLLRGQLLIPFLRSDYAEVLAAGEVRLHYDGSSGALYAQHFDHRFPLWPATYGEVLRRADDPALQALAASFDTLEGSADAWQRARELRQALGRAAPTGEALANALAAFRGDDPAGFERLHALLERQHYRLASWRTAADDINWRRFFDINELGGLRVERPEVFEAVHAKVFELIQRGLVDGLRLDHVDGLADPRGYCRRLRRRVQRLAAQRPAGLAEQPFPIYVEKILGPDEALPGDWMVDGTTGYEFMNQVSLLQHSPLGELQLCGLWSETSGRSPRFLDEVREARELILGSNLAGDLENLAQALLQVARSDLATRDLTLGGIRRALHALIGQFSVYRTYVNACGRSAQDQRLFRQAFDAACAELGDADRPLLGHLERWLGGEPLRAVPLAQRRLRRQVVARFQQLTAPAAAKAVEDTACYRSAVLLSRNDVGFDPQRFSAPLEAFHAACQARAQSFPDNLLTTATHDHKRGEDSRARLAVLSERAAWFAECCEQWRRLAAPLREATGPLAISPGDELVLYQCLLGSWPLDLAADDHAGLAAYRERLLRWQEKALREAKLQTSWSAPNGDYEGACRAFLDSLLGSDATAQLRRGIADAALAIAPSGALNGLVQCLLRMTTPGVPDLYQGTEFWDFSLVDPDNRRPVDYAARIDALGTLRDQADLLLGWRDGRIKQWLIGSVLSVRYARAGLFARGDYQPLPVHGEHAERVIAFARQRDGEYLVVIAPRLVDALLEGTEVPQVPPLRWGDTRVELPFDPATGALAGVFSREPPQVGPEGLALSRALADFPVNLLCFRPHATGVMP